MIGLNCADLVSDLDFIFSTDMLNLNKSQNEFFERVSQIIGVPKEDCVMFEDSLYAMQGARNARPRRDRHDGCPPIHATAKRSAPAATG